MKRCRVCGDKAVLKQRCRTCYQYARRHGQDRSDELVAKLTMRDIERERGWR